MVKINKAAERKEPIWRGRLQNKIKKLRKELRQVESSKGKDVSNVFHWQTLDKKTSIRVKTLLLLKSLKKSLLTFLSAVI